MKRFPVILLVVALLLGVLSCSNDGCLDNKSALPKAALYSSTTGKPITLNNISISGVGAPGDSVLVSAGEAVSEVYLPMRSTENSTSWNISYTGEGLEAMNDVVTFDYDSQPYFASDECGAIFRYLITRCDWTEHLIDSVVVTDSLITNVDMVRIKIYFRTAEAPEEPEE